MNIRLHAFMPKSRVNGPGVRACIWFQGCSHNCSGCCNPAAKNSEDGKNITVNELFEKITGIKGIEGVSVSGGEPFQQPEALYELLKVIKERSGLSVLAFTGYSVEEIYSNPDFVKILAFIDILVSGRYDYKRAVKKGLLGSSNQKIYFLTSRYKPEDLESLCDLEIIIEKDGTITATGISSPDILFNE